VSWRTVFLGGEYSKVSKMTKAPQVSVIIPTYNRATLLREAIKSILRQTYQDYEIVVVDDGSTDDTAAVMKQLIRQQSVGAERIRYLFQENRGKSAALNYGLRQVRGEWIAFLDSDDQWLPTKLEEQFCAIQQCVPNSEACFTNARYINNPNLRTTVFERARKTFRGERGVITDRAEFIASPHGIFMQTLLVHSRVMKRVGEFDVSLRVIHDLDIVFRIFRETPLCYVNKPLVLIDRTPQRREGLIELLVQNDDRDLDAQQRMYERWLCLSGEFGKDAQDAARTRLSGTHGERANWHLQNRRYREALRAISAAARVKWTPGIVVKWCLTTIIPPVARSIVLSRSRRGIEQELMLSMGCGDTQGAVPLRSDVRESGNPDLEQDGSIPKETVELPGRQRE
jgi:glycosyltransferase involved in cell wall biosynthesis